ncbi:FxsA family protein [Colwellia sp. D2M02]|uniref:FxsA family protein n=1 Tax=Colwellia sp. D2M02 TaxID=2841562 RepID=UPI001C081FDD|nr:FxsA family protein [Colwellia sp. D2M02]MBU2893664.1 FxsA family protein [Colwellia sp. D2M02]
MFRVLFLLFIIIPIIEIAVLMQVGALLGLWPTIAIVIASAWLGAKYVRQQGLATMQSVQTKMAQGEMPSNEIVTGLLLLVAGVLLVTPGFVTDIFGLSLLIPAVRNSLVGAVQKNLVSAQVGSSPFSGNAHFYSSHSTHTSQGNVYEHEVQTSETYNTNEPVKPISHHQGETLEGSFERKE